MMRDSYDSQLYRGHLVDYLVREPAERILAIVARERPTEIRIYEDKMRDPLKFIDKIASK